MHLGGVKSTPVQDRCRDGGKNNIVLCFRTATHIDEYMSCVDINAILTTYSQLKIDEVGWWVTSLEVDYRWRERRAMQSS